MIEVGSAVVAALVAGATAALKDTAGQAVKDAYQSLKELLAGRLTSLATLEQDPADEDYQQAAAKELDKKRLAEDEAVVAKAHELLEIALRTPPDQLAVAGVDVQRVRAATDVLVNDIESRGGITVKDVEAKAGRVDIGSFRTGGTGGNG